jgi:hypothetical protein
MRLFLFLLLSGSLFAKPILWVNVDSGPWSHHLKTELVDKPEFSNLLGDQFEIKERAGKEPSVSIESEGIEIAKFGIDFATPQNLALAILSALESYSLISQNILNNLEQGELRDLYLRAKKNHLALQKDLFQTGLEKDSSAFFYLEKYRTSTSRERKKLRDEIVKRDQSQKAQLKMALVDINAQIQKKSSPEKMIREFLKDDADDLSIYLMESLLADYLHSKGDAVRAQKHRAKAEAKAHVADAAEALYEEFLL